MFFDSRSPLHLQGISGLRNPLYYRDSPQFCHAEKEVESY